jgi:hypothetical protein
VVRDIQRVILVDRDFFPGGDLDMRKSHDLLR